MNNQNKKTIHQLFADLHSLAPAYETMLGKPFEEIDRRERRALYDHFWAAIKAVTERIDELIEQGKTLKLVTSSGCAHWVRARGMIVNTAMMNYSEKRDARYCFGGVRLDRVVEVEVVDDETEH